MNILPLYNVSLNRNAVNNNSKNAVQTPRFGLKMSNPISADQVSFGAAKATMKDFFVKAAEENNKKYIPIASEWLDALENVVVKYKDKGISFDREYCEPHVIKGADSVVDKMERGDEVRDRIRATIFNNNIYDLSILVNCIIPELADFRKEINTPIGAQGIIHMLSDPQHYFIADEVVTVEKALKKGHRVTDEEKKKGHVMLPDIDIRLSEVKNIEALPDNLSHALSKPQASGYEDIQMRFAKYVWNENKNEFVRKEGEPLLELIILTGRKYAEAKADESKYIYSNIRQFKKLHVLKKEDNEDIAGPLNAYIDSVKTIFAEVSSRVYKNAKNFDLYGIETGMKVEFNDGDDIKLNDYYEKIEDLIKTYYAKKIKELKVSKIQKLSSIKKSHMDKDGKLTQEGFEKSKPVKLKYNSQISALEKDRYEDLVKLSEIKAGLKEAFKFYSNYENKKNPKIKKPKKADKKA